MRSNAEKKIKYKKIVTVAAFLAATSACAPAVLTLSPLESNLTSPYFDNNIRWRKPHDVHYTERFIQRRFVQDGTNNGPFIREKFREGGGTCTSQGADVTCTMHRRLVSVACFNGICDKALQKWVLTIRWRETGGAVMPRVKINMTLDRLPN